MAASNMQSSSRMQTDEYSGDALDGETDESHSISRFRRKIGKTCRCCGEEAPIALKKCKNCGDQFPKKEKNWQSITKLKAPNPTVQRDLLERRADILNHHCDYDIVIMYKRKHLNGVSISTYGTQGLGEAFISGEGEIGMTFKHMFEAFCGEYGKNNAMPHQSSDAASELIFTPPSDGNHVPNPASPVRVVECGNTSQDASLAGFKLPEAETSEDSSRPTVVFYRENGNNVAVGYLHQERHNLHGKPVPRDFYVVQVTWVADQEGGVAAPIILGDAEENRLLSPGKFFALPRAQLARVRVV